MANSFAVSRPIQAVLISLVMVVMAGCATRPGSEILRPTKVAAVHQTVDILVATNRSLAADGNYSADRASMHYERYTISVPPRSNAGEIVYPSRSPSPDTEYIVVERKPLSLAEFIDASQTPRPLSEPTSLFVHGYNQSFQEALFRLAQVGADANYHAPMILFAWPSEADLLGYIADKDRVLASRGDLSTLIGQIASNAADKRLFVFGHSMGGFLVMEALRELRIQDRHDVVNRLSVALAAPDIDVAVFGAQLETIGNLREPITVLVSREDRALQVSSHLGSDRPRVGLLDVQDPAVQSLVRGFGINVVDITALKPPDRFGHDGYASLAQHAQLFLKSQSVGLSNAVELGLLVFAAPTTILPRAGQ